MALRRWGRFSCLLTHELLQHSETSLSPLQVLAGKPHVTVCWQGFADSHNSDTPVDDILEPLHTYCWANEQAWARCCEWFRDCAELRLQQAGSQAVQAAQGGQARGQGGGRCGVCLCCRYSLPALDMRMGTGLGAGLLLPALAWAAVTAAAVMLLL